MLTCEICGEEMLLEEDMKTHLLLSHLENDMQCPLCSLSGVSYDDLRFHISLAHPEKQQRAARSIFFSGCCTVTESEETTNLFQAGLYSCETTSEVSATADPVPRKQRCKPKSGCSSAEATLKIPSLTAGSTRLRCQAVQDCNEDDNRVKSEQNKAKEKRQTLQREVKLFSCPMCALDFSNSFILQDHVELHLHKHLPTEGEKNFECPLCPVVCSDSFSLQEHVELHLEQETPVNSSGSPGPDLKLARQLQKEEVQRWSQEEAKQEREEFRKLQRQFGLDGRGGYCRQMERAMDRAVARGLISPAEFHCKKAEMMESLSSGVDDGATKTSSVVRALYEYYQTECRDCAHVWLSTDTDHYCSSLGDKGWGCGYRNFQMLLSSLQRIDTYAAVLQETTVPNIPQIQRLIEGAWKEGVDPQGALHFNQHLVGTRSWIGATEVFSLLTFLGINARIIDFHQPTGPGDTHPRLFDWVKQYFCQSNGSSKVPPRCVHTCLPPLYLQHQGHSRSIVGLEQKKNGTLCLLFLDPGYTVSDTRKLLSRKTVSTAIRHIRAFPGSLKHKQYQLVMVQGVLSAHDKQMSIMNSKTLCAERIP